MGTAPCGRGSEVELGRELDSARIGRAGERTEAESSSTAAQRSWQVLDRAVLQKDDLSIKVIEPRVIPSIEHLDAQLKIAPLTEHREVLEDRNIPVIVAGPSNLVPR